MLKTELNKTDH